MKTEIGMGTQRKVPDDSETSIMPSDSEADVSNEVWQYVSQEDKKRAVKRLKLTGPSESTQKMLQLVRISTSTPGRKTSHTCAFKEFLHQDKNTVVFPDEKKSKKDCDTVCFL